MGMVNGRPHPGGATLTRTSAPGGLNGSPRRNDLIGSPRIAQLHGLLAALGHTVNGRGGLRRPGPETRPTGSARKDYIRDIARACLRFYPASDADLDAGSTPVMLGGDHSVATGSVAATAGCGLGGRARRHEHTVDEYHGKRTWYVARRLVGTGTG